MKRNLKDEIQTWQQGSYLGINDPAAEWGEKFLVRPYGGENPICKCIDHDNAKWIASRLNLASILEEKVFSFVRGEIGKEDMERLVDKLCYARKQNRNTPKNTLNCPDLTP